MDSLSRNSKKDTKLQHSLGRALEFVKVESKYQKVLQYLLAGTFIVQDLETARRILKDTDLSVRLITLDGEILTRTSIIGGSLPKDLDSSLLGRRERTARTEEELERIKKEKRDIESLKVLQDSEIKELNGQIQQKEPELNGLKIERTSKESEKANIETEKKRLQDEVSVLKLEVDESSGQIEQLQGEEKDLNQQLLRLKLEQKEVQDRIQRRLELIAKKSQEKQNTLVEIAEAKAKALALDRETEGAERRLQMIFKSEADQRQAQQAGVTEVQNTVTRIEQLRQQIRQQKLESKDLSQTKVNLEEELNKTLKRRLRLSAAIQDLEGRLRESQKEVSELRERRTSLQLRLTELNYKQGSLKDKMHQSYLVDLEVLLDKSPQTLPPELSVFEEIKGLKTRLEGMGPVNLVAIEENDQLQQRYSFLISQQEDLVGAQESLRKAITQINHTARKCFSETFQKIQAGFKEYFRILFGGGDARLILIEENNILESGIEIVVRPPGRKLQNISLLSGGEKALTAIALLFSIFKVKPSPFCILDEVDAPLDEANIDRFTNLLSEFIKTSQFIIVTHNKKTINMADLMYGITMEKSGVSKIVSVRFAEEQGSAARELAQIEG